MILEFFDNMGKLAAACLGIESDDYEESSYRRYENGELVEEQEDNGGKRVGKRRYIKRR